jgi:hypothetical protein
MHKYSLISFLDVGQLDQFFRFENKSKNCWFNSMMQMMLASGHIVEAIKRMGLIDPDMAPTCVMVTGNMLHCLTRRNMDCDEPEEKAIVRSEFIEDHIGYYRFGAVSINARAHNCIMDFFAAAIVPWLLHYDIEFQFGFNMSMECSSCKEASVIQQQVWDCLLAPQATAGNPLDSIIVDLFRRTLLNSKCPKCLNDGLHYSSMSLMNCPKDLFTRFIPAVAPERALHKLTTHLNLTEAVSERVIFTRSYARYTLQSFVVLNGKDNAGHYVTFAQRKGEWFRLDDTNITLVTTSSLFGDDAELQPVVLAHYTRPSIVDVFSLALWNGFTNFAPLDVPLPPSLSLNDAATYFAKHNMLEINPLNFVFVKYFKCSSCTTGKPKSCSSAHQHRTDRSVSIDSLSSFHFEMR